MSRLIERMVAIPLRQGLGWAAGGIDGRWLLFAALTIYLGIIAAGRVVFAADLWPTLGVPSGPSLFFDARNLTAAWECQRLGYDTLYQNPCDPWGRPLNYPRSWLLLGVLGLDQSHTFVLAAVLIAVMFVSYGLFVGRVTAGTGVLLALAACSPAVMLAVERANLDVVVFSILVSALLLWRMAPGPARIASPVLTLVAATGKIYPAFALPAFLMAGSRSAARAALVCLAVFGTFLAFNADDVAHIAGIAPQGQDFAYGARILLAHLYHQVGADRWAAPAMLKQAIAAGTFGVGAVVVALWARRRLAPPEGDVTPVSAARLGLHLASLIYLGTFVAGNNFDYRLVFLLLTLPQLVEWVRDPAHRLSQLASLTLTVIVVLLWVGSLSQFLSLWDELASWLAAGLLGALGAATLPRFGDLQRVAFGRAASVVGHSGGNGARVRG